MSPLRFLAIALSLLSGAALAQSAPTAPASGAPAIDKTKLSYAIGYQIGTSSPTARSPMSTFPYW